MRKIILLPIVLTVALISAAFEPVKTEVRVYYLDERLFRLIPITVSVEAKSRQATADEVVRLIIEGRDDIDKIKRTLPEVENGITVKLDGNIARVDIARELASSHEHARELEKFSVYQIVNSLCSVDGVEYVSFTVGGELAEDFVGYMDMRQIFTADNYI